MHFGFMYVILLHSGHQHVSVTHVAILRVRRTGIQMQRKCVCITPQFKQSYSFWLKFTVE